MRLVRLDVVDAAARAPTRLVRESRSSRDGAVPTQGPSVNLAARLMCAASKSDKDVYVESGIERATSVSPQARLCVFNACEPIKAKGFAEMVKVFSLEVRSRRLTSMRVVSFASLSRFGPRRGRRGVSRVDGVVTRQRCHTRVYVVLGTPSTRCHIGPL